MSNNLRSSTITRRQFLRQVGILGAGAALGGSLLVPGRSLANGAEPIRTVAAAGRKVCLTYDDLWSEYYTFRIARFYHERGIRIGLFPIGHAITNNLKRPHEGYEDLYPRMRDMGHEIGCHLYTHRNHREFSLQQLIDEEMEPALQAMRQALGEDFTPIGIRPPYGIMTDAIRELSALYGIPLILWGVDSQDSLCTVRTDCDSACSAPATNGISAEVSMSETFSQPVACTKKECEQICVDHILDRLDQKLRPGSVVLNHSIRNAYLAVAPLLRMLRRRDLQPVALSELLAVAG
ncbi:MAG: polysaccharide deacetylase family protein [Chloroflexi bacterium]|nr:polysaccharide deacetylase family protein [Chloroflexota bacterium]